MPKAGVLSGKVAQRVLRVRQGYGSLLRPLVIRRPVQMLADGISGMAAVLAAYCLRYDLSVPGWARRDMWIWAATFSVLNPISIWLFNGYRSTWQFFGVRDLRRLLERLALVSIGVVVVQLALVPRHRMPYTVMISAFILSACFSSSVRLMRRIDHEALSRLGVTERVLILGKSNAIANAIHQLAPLYGPSICGALTDDERFHQSLISGVPILGTTEALAKVIHQRKINLLFICSADLPGLSDVIQTASSFNATVKFMPCVNDLLDDRIHIAKKISTANWKNVEGEDDVQLHPKVLECLEGRTVLVTGAGGSIGSELVRQIRTSQVGKLLILDHDENAMYELLAELGTKASAESVIADIRDRDALRSLFSRFRPDVVLHAAAYKHVPMMEANPCQAILNNVLGTRILAEVAMEFHADRLVMISSDKAVRPSSVMGASKRLAELEIQKVARMDGCTTQFACVRFGNVLGSRGSVLPMFLKQIEAGGPVTVTHEDMTRYFMSIPQAVSLVLQAATLASVGDVYMLDMGDPVKIIQFARDVIRRSGLMPDEDIKIHVVGTRPGEKLHEQLWAEDAHVTQTEFEQIFKVHADTPSPDHWRLLEELENAAAEFKSDRIRELLHELSIDYIGELPVRPSEPALTASMS